MSLIWKIALAILALLGLAVLPSYGSQKNLLHHVSLLGSHTHSEQFTAGYDWRQPENQY